MKSKLFFGLIAIFFAIQSSVLGQQAVEVSGKVLDESTEEPLIGVNVVVKGLVLGTITDTNGAFKLKINAELPQTLVFSYVGYQTEEVQVTQTNTSDITVTLSDKVILGKEIVVSASRSEENIMESPVSIEKMDILDVRNAASDDYYKAIANLKGVDISSSSINFQILNTRGFGSTGNTRFVQLTDMMDTQAPALNFPIGNLNGPSVLDVESVELIPGAASALYGANAFNGILLVNSKSPFDYQGLSVYTKLGMNHVGADTGEGAPESPQPMYEAAVRYAKSFNNKVAFKVNLSYMQAEDWYGTNDDDKNASFRPAGFDRNPAYDGVHSYGDDGGLNLGLLRTNGELIQQFSQTLQSQPFNLDPNTADQEAAKYIGSLPTDLVHRTGYDERHLVDYGAENLKVNAGLHYRITDKLEASYNLNFGYGTSVYTGAQRYSLSNFTIQQHKLELEADNFTLRGYTTIENSGDSYIADFTGFGINNAYLDNATWFGTYGGTIASQYLLAVLDANQSPMFDPAVVGGITSNPSAMNDIHLTARTQADANRHRPGSAMFSAAKDSINNGVIPNGARFDDNTRFYQVDGIYNFKNQITAFDLQIGGQWRLFDLQSNGTIFPDNVGGGITINEYGAFVQAGKRVFEDKLKLLGSIRYDKNENFDGQLSPRVSGVFSFSPDHTIRASYQTGFRNPTTQGQYIDLNVISARLLGGLPRFAEQYQVQEHTYTIQSVFEFTEDFLNNGVPNTDILEPFDFWEPVQPERVQVFEVGYRGIIADKLSYDIAYYRNVYNDFITQLRVRQVQDGAGNPIPIDAAPQAPLSLLAGDFNNTFQIYTNNDEVVNSQGIAAGMEYLAFDDYEVRANYSWNKLDEESLSDQFFNEFNTPEHTVNIGLGNRKVTEQLGFNINWRWQSEFEWQSSFAIGTVPAYSTLDFQVSYTVPALKSIFRFNASNALNDYYIANYGSPQIGGIYSVTWTFDEMFN